MKIKTRGYLPGISGSITVPQTEEGVRLLKEVPLFQTFSAEELKDIYPRLNPSIRRIDKKSSIIQGDDDEEQLAVVLYGGLTECRYAGENVVQSRCRYGPGSLIGVDMLAQKGVISEITADTECKLLVISIQCLLHHERYGLRLQNTLAQLQSVKNEAYPL